MPECAGGCVLAYQPFIITLCSNTFPSLLSHQQAECFGTVKGLLDAFSIKSNLYVEAFTSYKGFMFAFTLSATMDIGHTILVAVRCGIQTW